MQSHEQRSGPDRPPDTELERIVRSLRITHVTALLALGAVGLYAVGVVRTIGLLHAEGVATTRGIPLVPLQDYLVRGLSVVLTLNAVLELAFFGLVIVLVLESPRIARSVARRATGTGPLRESVFRPFAVLLRSRTWVVGAAGALLLSVLFVPVAEWAPAVLAYTFAFGTAAFAVRRGLSLDPRRWQPAHARVAGAVVVGYILIALLGNAYLTPPPIDRVVIRTSDGATLAGKLLAVSGGVVYMAGASPARRGRPAITALPIGRVATMQIAGGQPRAHRTLFESIGIRFWRFDWGDPGAGLHRSPP